MENLPNYCQIVWKFQKFLTVNPYCLEAPPPEDEAGARAAGPRGAAPRARRARTRTLRISSTRISPGLYHKQSGTGRPVTHTQLADMLVC